MVNAASLPGWFPLEGEAMRDDRDDEDLADVHEADVLYEDDDEIVLAATNHFTDIRGPQKCPRRCSECADGNHHWLTVTFPGCLDEDDDDYNEALSHPAVQEAMRVEGFDFEGVDYLACKHCEAWHPLTEAMLDDEDFEIV